MSKQAFYNGILYQIEYKPQLSNSDYTQHRVYHIKTDDENYPHAKIVKTVYPNGRTARQEFKKYKRRK